MEAALAQGAANISGGQKQRLSIARALVRDPSLLIFDDSFSALDFATDARLRQALAAKRRETTKIIVAQRVGTIMQAEKIIVLDHGRIVGMGTHRELMESCVEYREIAESQISMDTASSPENAESNEAGHE
jgi:ATP-binding cassette subfamily B protein